MITVDSDPRLNPVAIGAFILNLMAASDLTEMEIEVLYAGVQSEFNASYDVFAYTLDWLFVIGAIDLSGQGNVVYASL